MGVILLGCTDGIKHLSLLLITPVYILFMICRSHYNTSSVLFG